MSIPATREQQRERERSQRERQANAAQNQLSALRQQAFEPFPIAFNTEQYNTSEPSEDETFDDETSMNIQSIFGDFGEFSRKMKSSYPPIMNVIHPTTQNNNNNTNNNNNNNNHNNKKKVEQIFSEMKNKHKLHSTQKSSLPDLDSELNATAVKHSLKHNGLPYGQYNNVLHSNSTSAQNSGIMPLLQPAQPQQQMQSQSPSGARIQLPSSSFASTQSSISPHNAFVGQQDTHFRAKAPETSELYPHNTAPSRHLEPYNMNGHNINHGTELDNNLKSSLMDEPRNVLLKGQLGLSSSSSSSIASSIQGQNAGVFNSSLDHSAKFDSLSQAKQDIGKNNIKANLASDSSDSDSSSSSEDESGSSDSDSSDGSDSEIDKRKKPAVPVTKVPVKKQEPQPPPKSNSWDLENFIDCDLKPLVPAAPSAHPPSAIQNDKHCDQSKAYSNDPAASGKAAVNNKASSSKNSRQNTKKSTKQQHKASLNDVEEGEVEEQPIITKDEPIAYETFHDSRINRKDIVAEAKSTSINKLAESKGTSSSRNYGQTSSGSNVEEFKSKEEKLKSSFKENAEPRNLSRDSSSLSRKKPELVSPIAIESSPQSKTKSSSQRNETLAGSTASNSTSKHNSSSTTTSKEDARQQQRKQKRKHSSSDDEPDTVVPKRSSKSQRRPPSPPPSQPSSKESQKHLKMSDSDNKKDSNGFSNDSSDSYVVSIQLSKLNRVPNNLKRTLDEEKIKKRQSSPSSKESKIRDKEKSTKNRDEKAKSKIVDLPLQESKSTPPKKPSSSQPIIIKKETKDVPLDFGNVRTPPNITASSASISAKKVSPLTKGYSAPPLKGQSATAQAILRANIKIAELFERNLSDTEAMERAKKIKRQADSMADPVKQMAGHLESVMFFTMACLAFERKGLEENSIRLFQETLKYIEQATVSNRTTKIRYTQPLDVLAERKVQIIMYKIKGMINYRLFKLKEKNSIEHRETIASINADSGLRTFIKNVPLNASGTDQSLLIPVKNMLVAYECLLAHHQLYTKAHEQWSKADLHIFQNQECRDFFDALNSKFSMFTIIMPIEEFVNWTLNALKNLYVTAKSNDS